jgi:hypothetical protein
MDRVKKIVICINLFFFMLQGMDGDVENPDVAAIYVQERQRELGGEETDKEPDESLLDSDSEAGGGKGRGRGGGGGDASGGTEGEGGGPKKSVGVPAA